MSLNLYQALREGFPQDLSQVAITTDSGLRYSWQDLDRASAMMAHLLMSFELPPQARVVAKIDKSVEALMLYLACLRSGLVYVPINPSYQAAETEFFLKDAEPALVICPPEQFAWVSRLAYKVPVRAVFTLGAQRDGSLLERAAHLPDTYPTHQTADDDLAAIVYTSGTTGQSRGAMLTHQQLQVNAQVLKQQWRLTAHDVLLHALPTYHVHGLFVAIHATLLAGASMFWMRKFEPQSAIASMRDATVFMGVPTYYTRMLGEPALGPQAVKSMRLFVSGSAPLKVDTFKAWYQRTRRPIVERYGMSETVILCSNPVDEAHTSHQTGLIRAGSVGLPLPGVQLRLVNDQNEVCEQGDVGHVQVRGETVFDGYWRSSESIATDFTSDGYFKTGDIGRFDEDGYLFLVGRSKDVIITGGCNVYPAEIEQVILQVQGLSECAVIGVPHPDFGEAVVAVVASAFDADVDTLQIIAHCRHQLAPYKVPKQVVVVDRLPRNAARMVQKALLREQWQHLFGDPHSSAELQA